MRLIQMYDGYAIVSMHWTEIRLVVDALDAADVTKVADLEHSDTIGAAFEAAMYAGKLQVEVGDVTLRQFRAEQGMRDWQPHLVLHDVDDTPPDQGIGDTGSAA